MLITKLILVDKSINYAHSSFKESGQLLYPHIHTANSYNNLSFKNSKI